MGGAGLERDSARTKLTGESHAPAARPLHSGTLMLILSGSPAPTNPPPAAPAQAPGLRERALCHGAETLSDRDLLALILSTGVSGSPVTRIAEHLLLEAGGLGGISRLGVAELAQTTGVGLAKATRIIASIELGRRLLREVLEETRPILASAHDVAAWARPRLGPLEHEELWVLCLDSQNGLKAARRVAQGGLHGCAMSPRDLLRPAVSAAASAIVVLHNHPSGSPEPSEEDIEMTHHLALATRLVGITLLDHVIVARQRSCSLAELGVIP